MKSLVEEASTIAKAIEKAWDRAGKPREFSVKVFEEAETNFLGFTKKSAKVGIFFEETAVQRSYSNEHSPRHNQSQSRTGQRRQGSQTNRHNNNMQQRPLKDTREQRPQQTPQQTVEAKEHKPERTERVDRPQRTQGHDGAPRQNRPERPQRPHHAPRHKEAAVVGESTHSVSHEAPALERHTRAEQPGNQEHHSAKAAAHPVEHESSKHSTQPAPVVRKVLKISTRCYQHPKKNDGSNA